MNKVLEELNTHKILPILKGLEDEGTDSVIKAKVLLYELKLARIGGVPYHIKLWIDMSSSYSSNVINEGIEEFVVGSECQPTVLDAFNKAYKYLQIKLKEDE